MRLVLLIPVALYFSLEMSHGWTQMPFFDETMVQRGIYAMRTSQVFLIVPQFVELRMVVQALNCALGTTVPMVALMTIVTFAFAVIGMVAFGDTDISKRYHADNGTEARVFGSYWDVTRVRFSTISKSMNRTPTRATTSRRTTRRPTTTRPTRTRPTRTRTSSPRTTSASTSASTSARTRTRTRTTRRRRKSRGRSTRTRRGLRSIASGSGDDVGGVGDVARSLPLLLGSLLGTVAAH